MIKFTPRVWLSIGAASLTGTSAQGLPSVYAHAQHGHASAPTSSSPLPATKAPKDGSLAAPQGGEAYLTDGGPRDTRIRIYRDIGLMRGHLLVGGELVEQGLWDDALPHFLHPTEELYGAMERYIKLHKVTPFDRQLKALAQAVKAKNPTAYRQARKIVDERLAGALSAFKGFMTVQPFSSYTAKTVVEIVKVALSEYEAAIEGERFVKPVEYQDSRGFIWHADQLLKQHAGEFEAIDKARFAEMLALIGQMQAAWPAAMPPDKPVMSPARVSGMVDAFVAAATRFE